MKTERPLDDVRNLHKTQKHDAFFDKTKTLRYTLEGLALLLEAAAMGVTAGFAIYSGWYANLPTWGSWALLIAGAFIAIRAFVEFVKFLNRRA